MTFTTTMRTVCFVAMALGLLFVAPVQIAHAQDSELETLDTWGRNRGWEGVGLLNIEDRATCTGVMIQSDLVLTAAHCLFDPATGERMNPTKIEFRAGWRDGQAIASRFGKIAVAHPKYGTSAEKLSFENVRNDVALLQLSDPIPTTHADPFRADKGVEGETDVSVVSYGKGRNNAASRQRDCHVLEHYAGIVAMSCDAVPGSSGSPVFAMRNGSPRIVAVVSAIGNLDGQTVSYGMDIETPLAEVLAALRSGQGVFPSSVPSARRIAVGSGHSSTGARFLKP